MLDFPDDQVDPLEVRNGWEGPYFDGAEAHADVELDEVAGADNVPSAAFVGVVLASVADAPWRPAFTALPAAAALPLAAVETWACVPEIDA